MIYCLNPDCGKLITMADTPPFCRRCRAVECADCGRKMVVNNIQEQFRTIVFRDGWLTVLTKHYCIACNKKRVFH